MHFDGFNDEGQPIAPPAPPRHTNVPEPGTPEFAAWEAADKANRNRFGSGINVQRAATIKADEKAKSGS